MALPLARLATDTSEATILYHELHKPLLRYLVCLGLTAYDAQGGDRDDRIRGLAPGKARVRELDNGISRRSGRAGCAGRRCWLLDYGQEGAGAADDDALARTEGERILAE